MAEDKKKVAVWIGIVLGILAAIGLASAFKKKVGATIEFAKAEVI